MKTLFLSLCLFSNIAQDPWQWLENIDSEESLSWVQEQNTQAKSLETQEGFQGLQTKLLTALNSKEKLVLVEKAGDYCYNFWRDAEHVRGIWRRTKTDDYLKAAPAWETVLDLDLLAKEENEPWVWKECEFLHPGKDRVLLFLSRGGKDASVVREFDLKKNAFVKDGFTIPEAKTWACWKDRNTLYIASDFGEGTLTASGYPRIVKEWRRGKEPKVIFEGKTEDVMVTPFVVHTQNKKYEGVHVRPTFFTTAVYLRSAKKFKQIDMPLEAHVHFFDEHLLYELTADWKEFKAGSLVTGNKVLFEPTERASLQQVVSTKDFLIVNTMENMKNKVTVWTKNWTSSTLDVPPFGQLNISALDPNKYNTYFLTTCDYITPTTLICGDLKKKSKAILQTLPHFFNADNLEIQQFEATSKDGTKVPYFQVSRKGISLDGNNATLLYGYGGFQISLKPVYSAMRGIGWLEKGGVFVEANIRGGGEFGPNWHNAARKENRERAYDDFIAIAEDLVKRGVTSPKHLGIQGGSNGGLLVGVMLTKRPDLFGAVACHVPLLDMQRYHKLLAGASWIDEYGNPDIPNEWAYLQKYSPYHNLKADTAYPPTFFLSSTRDDRVHPGHARKMAAKMLAQEQPILYYETQEGGHTGAAANYSEIAYKTALEYTFLINELK